MDEARQLLVASCKDLLAPYSKDANPFPDLVNFKMMQT